MALVCLLVALSIASEAGQLRDLRDSHRTALPSRDAKPGSVRLIPLADGRPAQLATRKIAEAEQCTVFVDYPSHALYDWLMGWELYESYMQLSYPLVECENVYPFNVTDVCMTVVLNAPGSLYVQAFIADLDPDLSTPDCPYPGAFIAVTDSFPGYISQAGVYVLDVDFEQPVSVDGPYFAGIFYACDMTPFDPGIGVDTVPYYCLDYNDWGEGLVDLASNPYYPFPGSIDLFSLGYHGAAPSAGGPIPYFILPTQSGLLTPDHPVWLAEMTDSLEYQGAVLERLEDTAWVPFGVDFDGTVTLRNGVSPADTADGWRPAWNPNGFTDKDYTIRGTIVCYDTTYASDTTQVIYRTTPLEAPISAPSALSQFCDSDTIDVDFSPDADSTQFGWRQLTGMVSRALPLLSRSSYGDANGNLADGNHYYNGEFGEYYVGPVAIAEIIDYWATRGYSGLYPAGDSVQNVGDLVEWLATIARVRSNSGSQDDDLVVAAQGYLAVRNVGLGAEIGLPPTWSWLIEQYVAENATVALAISQPIGHWLTLAQLNLTDATPDSIPVVLYDPAGGISINSRLKIVNDSLYLAYPSASQLRFVDLAVAVQPSEFNDDYTWWTVDHSKNDGLHATLPTGLTTGGLYLLIASTYLGDLIFDAHRIFELQCAAAYLRGDSDHSGAINISDAVYIITWIFAGGPEPTPETMAGDADCDGLVNMTDVVYIINYIFASGPIPCDLR